jgi:nanoRNase/pAp phosphatase (c-di-AMP/oligoRNAs hydrolase)
LPGDSDDSVLLAVGKSILNRASNANISLLMLERGGGHEGVGTCQIEKDKAETALVELIAAINQAG